jgi:phospholipid/cholesterol/gamma-HCH transport system ATP-binding protein
MGKIFLDNQEISVLNEDKLLKVRSTMGYLFQEGALYDFMDVFDNVAFPLREHTDMDAPAIAGRVREVLNMVDLDDVEQKLPSQLSGGMKKRAGLARAIALGAKVLLCDEPTSGLDPIRSRDISNMIKQIVKQIGSTTVITSHDIENSFRIGDRFILLNEGHIAAMGNKSQLRNCPAPFVREFLQDVLERE